MGKKNSDTASTKQMGSMPDRIQSRMLKMKRVGERWIDRDAVANARLAQRCGTDISCKGLLLNDCLDKRLEPGGQA